MEAAIELPAVELHSHGREGDENGTPQEPEPLQQELRPADGGRDAWVVLIAGFLFEAVFWGTV